MVVRRQGDRLEISCGNGYPVCAVGARLDPRPGSIAIRDGFEGLHGALGEQITLDRLVRPESDLESGAHVWWNEDRKIVVEGYEETMERLRALGYIE